jgi:hypothetical protein
VTDDGFPYQTKRRLTALVDSLQTMVRQDPEQEVQGIAIPVIDAVIEDARSVLGDDPVVQVVAGIISPETIEAGEPIRAIDALVVAQQLDAAIGLVPPNIW